MRYDRYAPAPELSPYVEHFWTITADLDGWRDEILIPNGRPTLLISLGDTGRRKDPLTGASRPNVSGLSGIGTRPVVISQTGAVRLVAAQLSPFGPSGLGLPAAVDDHVPLAGWPAQLSVLEQGVSAKERLEAMLLDRLAPLPVGALKALQAAFALINADDGSLDIAGLPSRLGLSYPQLYRLFRRHVGITPKVALSIARYQRLVGGLLAGRMEGGLAQLAILRGYYDQAHANRDFRRFTGLSPRAFQESLNGIARMMHSQ